jgi:hypothetical protein
MRRHAGRVPKEMQAVEDDFELRFSHALGNSALLIRVDLHREGLMFPTYSYRGYIEAENFAVAANNSP